MINEQQKLINDLQKQSTTVNPIFTYCEMVSNKRKTETDVVLLAKVHSELREKSRIERNIVISGLPESTGKDEDEIEKNETAVVEQLLEDLKISKEKVKRRARLRKRGAAVEASSKPSLLLIEFVDSCSQTTALTNAPDLKKYIFQQNLRQSGQNDGRESC